MHMKLTTFGLLAAALLSLQAGCRKGTDDPTGTIYKGRLEIKGICMNYTLSVLEGDMDTAQLVAQWRDENSGNSYRNVFALANPCTFPSHLNQGDEFYFTIVPATQPDCAVCMAYYPVPEKKLSIKVVPAPGQR